MPLRDHFRPPTDDIVSWRELHSQWPARMVQYLRMVLPESDAAAPSVQIGTHEIDIAAYERDDAPIEDTSDSDGDGGVATATTTETATETMLEVASDVSNLDEFQVRIYDTKQRRQLVATIEIVSPANKDWPETRAAFVAKCSMLIRHGVAVSIVDLVTTKQFNLYTELLTHLGQRDPLLGTPPPAIYATSCRWVPRKERLATHIKAFPLVVGQPLPTLPLWLPGRITVPLELEVCYEQACHDLSIP